MNEPERTTIARLREHADALTGELPVLDPIRRRAERRRSRRRIASVVAATVLVVGVVLPLRQLSRLGDERETTAASQPWRETYVLSRFRVIYPFVDRSGSDGSAVPDLTKAGVAYESAWSGGTYPGEAPCSIELFDKHGGRVGSQSFNFATLTPLVHHDAVIGIPFDGAPPVSADGTCGPATPPGPGTYVFTDLRVVTDGDDRLVADVAWSSDEPPLTQSCIASFSMADGAHDERSFTLDAGQGADVTLLLLPQGLAGAAPLGVYCEPYTGPGRELTPSPSEAPDGNTYEDPASAFSVRLPPEWQQADRPLTQLIDPVEIFSAGTFAMSPGGSCPQFPTNAVADMGPHDAFVTILERKRLDPAGAQGPPRPASFGPADGSSNSDVNECLGTAKAFFDRWIAFSDQGREFYAFVAMGTDVSDQRRAETWAMLDSLAFDPLPARSHATTWTASMVSVGNPAVVSDASGRTWVLVELDSADDRFQAEGPVLCNGGSAGDVEIVGDHQGIQLTCPDGLRASWFGDGLPWDGNPPGYEGRLGTMPLVAASDGTLFKTAP
jgi:hypothetical protein